MDDAAQEFAIFEWPIEFEEPRIGGMSPRMFDYQYSQVPTPHPADGIGAIKPSVSGSAYKKPLNIGVSPNGKESVHLVLKGGSTPPTPTDPGD